jgi:hypothetical protein
MFFILIFFGLGFFISPWPWGIVASFLGGGFGTYLVKDRYLETKRLAGNAAYSKILGFAFLGSWIIYLVLLCFGYGLSLLLEF